MFTVLFAIGRTVGWVSQWKEMIEDPINKIGRPRQLYLGSKAREYKTIESREKKSNFFGGSLRAIRTVYCISLYRFSKICADSS